MQISVLKMVAVMTLAPRQASEAGVCIVNTDSSAQLSSGLTNTISTGEPTAGFWGLGHWDVAILLALDVFPSLP